MTLTKVLLGICSLLALLSSFTETFAQQSANQSLFLMWDERGKYGFIDATGRVVIKPQTKFSCRNFKEGFALVGVYNETAGEDFDGYINKQGELAIGGGYVRADPFSEGLARVVDSDKTVFIDSKGETVIDLTGYDGRGTLSDEYVPSGSFSEGLAEVGIKVFSQYGYSRYAFINKKGKVVFKLPEKFRAEGPFQNGRAVVFQEQTKKVRVEMGDGEIITQEVDVSAYGYIDKTGRVVIPARYSEAEDFSDALAVVNAGEPKPTNRRDLAGSAAETAFKDNDSSWMCINTSGAVVIKRCGEPLSSEELAERFPQFGESFGKGFVNGLFFSKTHVGGN
ncbi:MAG: WG repeat-containing protein [Pyrinomonadaceae bacterium]|nr:WG repeat-containing protein [Pyrinomonadaceae bacterium]